MGDLVAEAGAQPIQNSAGHGDLHAPPAVSCGCCDEVRLHSSSMERSSVTTLSWPLVSSSGRMTARARERAAPPPPDERVLIDRCRFHQRFENGAEIADGNLLAQQLLQDLLHFTQAQEFGVSSSTSLGWESASRSTRRLVSWRVSRSCAFCLISSVRCAASTEV